jgi:hypothetical protein
MRLFPLLLLSLLGACASHVVTVEATGPGKATVDVPSVRYLAAQGNGTLTVTLDGAEAYRLDVSGKKAWKRTGSRLSEVPWNEAAAALGLPLEPTQ